MPVWFVLERANLAWNTSGKRHVVMVDDPHPSTPDFWDPYIRPHGRPMTESNEIMHSDHTR